MPTAVELLDQRSEGNDVPTEQLASTSPSFRRTREASSSGPLDSTASATAAKSSLAVIVPVYNEERTVAELLSRLEVQPCVSQIIIVDDGSTDRTWAELLPWRTRAEASEADEVSVPLGIIVLQHDVNRGKGRAIRTALDHVNCSHLIIQDADLEYDPTDINRLWVIMESGTTDVVFGSRYLNHSGRQRGRFVLQLGIRLLNMLVSILYGTRLTDEATCYKLFSAADLRAMKLQCVRFEFCPEAIAGAARLGLTIREVPISYSARSHAEGKKLRLVDGWIAMRVLIVESWKQRFRNPLGNTKHQSPTTGKSPAATSRTNERRGECS